MKYLLITLIAKYGPEAMELASLYVRIQIKMTALFPTVEVVHNLTDAIF